MTKSERTPVISINPKTDQFVKETLGRLSLVLPFSEEHNGLNFLGADEALVVNALVEHDGLYLALLRSSQNDSHQGAWNNVAGYMQGKGESDTTILDTLGQELSSEANIALEAANSVGVGEVLEVSLPTRRLHIVPALVRFAYEPIVTLNEEHEAYAWITREKFLSLPHVPVVERVFKEMIGGLATN